MKKQQFINAVKRNYPWIQNLEKAASQFHEAVNQKYDHGLPYGFHLKLTASYVSRYGCLVAESDTDILILYAAAYLHDTIEDARLTYNDIIQFISDFCEANPSGSEIDTLQIVKQVPEIVYALTNEKGRNRKERANEAYYRGIRVTKFAPFVKMCDRLANIQYSVLFFLSNRMLNVYRLEYPGFIRLICEGAVTPVPKPMRDEAERLLNSEAYVM